MKRPRTSGKYTVVMGRYARERKSLTGAHDLLVCRLAKGHIIPLATLAKFGLEWLTASKISRIHEKQNRWMLEEL